jgi:hypothetical protein
LFSTKLSNRVRLRAVGFAVLAFAAAVVAPHASAANDDVTLSGHIDDLHDLAVANAAIVASTPYGYRRATSDSRGNFTLLGLSPAQSATIAFEKPGFSPATCRLALKAGHAPKLLVVLYSHSIAMHTQWCGTQDPETVDRYDVQ